MSSPYASASRDALIEAIRESGLGVSEFAGKYLCRRGSTVYRWLSGEIAVPGVVSYWLVNYADEMINGEDQ